MHGPPGPQTIGFGGAAASIVRQSASTVHGYWGDVQTPQPETTPPGLHERKLDSIASRQS
jgi:hypothetical protein